MTTIKVELSNRDFERIKDISWEDYVNVGDFIKAAIEEKMEREDTAKARDWFG